MCQFCTRMCRHLPYGNPKFSITFRYLNIYVSSQKFHKPSYTGQKNTVKVSSHLGTRKKNFQHQIFSGGHFCHWRKMAWFWLPLLRGLFSYITNLFFYRSYLNIWGTLTKRVWVYMILGLGFMAILKKALWGCHMANAGVNGLIFIYLYFLRLTKKLTWILKLILNHMRESRAFLF